MFGFLKKQQKPSIALPRLKETICERNVIYIKIHEHDKLSDGDKGRALASYVRVNKLSGYPKFDSKLEDGLCKFVLNVSVEDADMIMKERELRQAEIDRQIIGLVRMEIVTPNV